MFMSVNKRPYISYVNDVECKFWKKKKFFFANKAISNPILSQLRRNKENYNYNSQQYKNDQ